MTDSDDGLLDFLLNQRNEDRVIETGREYFPQNITLGEYQRYFARYEQKKMSICEVMNYLQGLTTSHREVLDRNVFDLVVSR